MSTAAKVENPAGPRRDATRRDAYFAAVRDTNPFASNIVREPSSYDVDVPAIHADAFDRLADLAGQALREESGLGAVLLAGAGIGKSHLLSRLYRWAAGPAGDGGPRACYVYLHNILADPERLPRYMLKYAVSRLAAVGHGPMHQTPLYRLVDRAIRHAMESSGVGMDDPRGARDAYRAYFACPEGGRDAYEVLYQFLRHARPEKADDPVRRRLATEAVAWLSGDEIDPEAAKGLGLKAEGHEPVMLRDDHEVERVLLCLARLALVSRQPFILCVDQVENLDPDKLKPLARFLHALLDHAANLLVITSGVKQTLLAYREDDVIPEAAWDRIARYKVELRRIAPADARKIVEARLERFHEPFLDVEDVRRRVHQDTLFPLGRAWLDEEVGDALELRPRDVLSWARDAWDQRRAGLARLGGDAWIKGWPDEGRGKRTDPKVIKPVTQDEIEEAIDGVVDRKVAEQVAQHRLQPGSLPPDAGNLAGLVESLLAHCDGEGLPYTFRGVERMKKKAGKLPPYDLLVRERREGDGRAVTTGVLFITNVGLSATVALKRLLEDENPPDHRLLVTDDERRPLKVGAQGVEYYRDLGKLGPSKFEHLKINFEQYAGLDALREVIGLARSGDLEIELPPGAIRPVTEAEVVTSHHRRDRLRRHPLLRPLLTEEPAPVPAVGPEKAGLDEADVRQYVVGQLAWMMGSTAQAIAKGYLASKPALKVTTEAAWAEVKAITGRMHAEGLIHATPHDDDLFLLKRK